MMSEKKNQTKRPLDYQLRLRVEWMLESIGNKAERLRLYRVANWLASPLLVREHLCPQLFLVILSGGIRSTGQLSDATLARIQCGVRIFQSGLARYIICSGGRRAPHRPNSARRMKALVESYGIPASSIITEERSSRTAENAQEVSRILHAHGAASTIIVTSPFHMRRAKLCFEKYGITVYPAPAYQISPSIFQAQPRLFKEILHEYIGLAYYQAQRWI